MKKRSTIGDNPRDALDRVENQRGEPFPPRESELKGGRSMK
jgi:hypothetical protein